MGAIPQAAPQGFGGGLPNQGFGGGQRPQGFGQQPGGFGGQNPLGGGQPQTGLQSPQFQQIINQADTAGAQVKFGQSLNKQTEGLANAGFQELDQATQQSAKSGGGGGG